MNDIEMNATISYTNEDGETETETESFVFKGVEVDLRGTEDISDVVSIEDATYVFDVRSVNKMKEALNKYVGNDGELIDLWFDFN